MGCVDLSHPLSKDGRLNFSELLVVFSSKRKFSVMEKDRINDLLDQAKSLLEMANEEMSRSEEDVVTFMVCHGSRRAIVNYLQGFLLRNGVEPGTAGIEKLLEKCQKLDGRFSVIDFSPVYCRFEYEEKEYCLGTKKVGECLDIANRVEKMVVGSIPAY